MNISSCMIRAESTSEETMVMFIIHRQPSIRLTSLTAFTTLLPRWQFLTVFAPLIYNISRPRRTLPKPILPPFNDLKKTLPSLFFPAKPADLICQTFAMHSQACFYLRPNSRGWLRVGALRVGRLIGVDHVSWAESWLSWSCFDWVIRGRRVIDEVYINFLVSFMHNRMKKR